MKDPAPILVEYFSTLIPDLVDGNELFEGVSFHPIGQNVDLVEPYTIVTYETSDQNEFSRDWETVMLIQHYHRKPTTADYETEPTIDQSLLERQCRRAGAELLRLIGEWYGGEKKCVYGFWIINMGRAGNTPQTSILGDDDTYVHDTRFSVITDTSRAYPTNPVS